MVTATPVDRSNSPPIISSADRARHDADGRGGVQHGRQRVGVPERRRDDQEEDEDDDRAEQGADLGADQQALQTVLFLHPFVADDFVTREVQIGCVVMISSFCPGALAGSGLGEFGDRVDVGLVDERRAGQGGCPPPMMLPLLMYSHRESMAR